MKSILMVELHWSPDTNLDVIIYRYGSRLSLCVSPLSNGCRHLLSSERLVRLVEIN